MKNTFFSILCLTALVGCKKEVVPAESVFENIEVGYEAQMKAYTYPMPLSGQWGYREGHIKYDSFFSPIPYPLYKVGDKFRKGVSIIGIQNYDSFGNPYSSNGISYDDKIGQYVYTTGFFDKKGNLIAVGNASESVLTKLGQLKSKK